jgi:hypothetical protein
MNTNLFIYWKGYKAAKSYDIKFDMKYEEFEQDKYIYYECFNDLKGFVYIENENHIEETFFATSKIIRVSKYIPRCFHGFILRYYYY